MPILGSGGRLGSAMMAIATSLNIGAVRPDGTTLSVDGAGVIKANLATTTAAGAVQVGSGLAISNGVLSTTGYGYAGVSAYNS